MVSLQDILARGPGGPAGPTRPSGPSRPGMLPPTPAETEMDRPDAGEKAPPAENETDVLKRLVILMLGIPQIRAAIQEALDQRGGMGAERPEPVASPPGPGMSGPGAPPSGSGSFVEKLRQLQRNR